MRNLLTLFLITLSLALYSQKLDCRDIENRFHSLERFKNKTLTESNVKKCLTSEQKIVKIEIFNNGSLEGVLQHVNIMLVKVNDGNYQDALKDFKNLGFAEKPGREEANNWSGGKSGLISDSGFEIEEFLTVHKEYLLLKEVADFNDYHQPVPSHQIFESAIPVLNFEIEIVTLLPNLREDYPLSKEIKIYYDNQLVKTFTLNSSDLRSKIIIDNFQTINLWVSGKNF